MFGHGGNKRHWHKDGTPEVRLQKEQGSYPLHSGQSNMLGAVSNNVYEILRPLESSG